MATTLCRVCLNNDIRLQTVSGIYLDTYEKLTNIKLSADTECGMPSTVCYICHRQLQRCHTFSEMARKSNRVLQEWLCNGTQVTNNALVLRPSNVMQTLVVAPTVNCSCTNLSNASRTSVPVKEEQVSVKIESDSNKGTSDYDDINTEECMLETLNTDAETNQHSNKTDSVLENDINARTKNHMHIHTGVKPFLSCNRCNKKFSDKSYLTKHMRIHTGKKPFSCNRCDKMFRNKSTLTTHIRIHTGETPFSCNRCDKMFKQKSALTSHIRIHTGKKPFSCNRCDKMFKQKSNLTTHIRIHTGETPFSCNRCDKMFNQKGALTSHIRIHTGEKPYSCDMCDKTFSDKSNLKRHILIHTGEKPYSCDRCNKTFNDKSTLNRHMVTHTGVKRFPCNRCNKTFKCKSSLRRHMHV